MSSLSSSPTPTDAAAPSASATDNGNNTGGGSPSSTLYLLTFLATLFVLLFVSCAIVLRSFLIRRRYRIQLEQQIALGIIPPDFFQRRRDFGEKPQLWDVHVCAEDEKGLLAYDGWDDVLPVSAHISHDPNLPPESGKSSPAPAPSTSTMPSSRYQLFSRSVLRRNRRTSVETTSSSSIEASAPPEIAPDQEIQIAVVVAMPSQSHRHDEVPEILIGMSTVPVKGEP